MHGNFGSKGQVNKLSKWIQFLSRSLDSIVQVASPQGLFDYPKSHRAVSSAGWGPALARFGHCHSTTRLSWKPSLWAWKSRHQLRPCYFADRLWIKVAQLIFKGTKATNTTDKVKTSGKYIPCHKACGWFLCAWDAIITCYSMRCLTYEVSYRSRLEKLWECFKTSKLQPSVLNSCTKPNLSWHFETVYISKSLVTEKVVSMHGAAQYAWSAP